MERANEPQPEEWDGEGDLPDVPDAGADAEPIIPPDPIDISTGTLVADGAQVAGTLGEEGTLYEQALEVFEDDEAKGGAGKSMKDEGGAP